MNTRIAQLQAYPAATVDALFDAFDAGGVQPCTILPKSPWQAVTADQPPALQDMMVSVYDAIDNTPHTFMAWRTKDVYGVEKWMLSGSATEELRMQVYAFAPIIEPAPMPAQQALG